ncbi:MAG: UvrD-helicase domain-containing protein [Spirochaetia bacterium]|nr:UvrD-helicase domain-containing protein [Spirochaetia bacterium]
MFILPSMRIVADLHIHSHYSRATSLRLTPPCLERWARIKGIRLLGTGDCTHPGWLEELRGLLEDAEEGFYTLKGSARKDFDAGPGLADGLPDPPRAEDPRFVLSGEISTIYSCGGKTRKVHHLVILPDFGAARAFSARLAKIGNISSDGRPILGIDSRDLLAALLDTDSRAILVPAHIWTPWFSALGAKSGFDSLEECYRDLAVHVHALETGLSSNPPMNWAVGSLDGFAIMSNSDAHSPDKLGREATVFDMRMEYPSLAGALGYGKSGDPDQAGIIETIEFFPQEGKYHYDGHRACGVVLSPEESAASGGLCPVCGKPLTCGVMRRVLELADRPVDESAPCPDGPGRAANQKPYRSLIPLKELAAELLETGVASKKTAGAYGFLVEKAGSEFSLLMDMGLKDIEALRCPGIPGEVLALAIGRVREGRVSISPGYDGEYGIIHAFAPREKISAKKEAGLFEETMPAAGEAREAKEKNREGRGAPSRGGANGQGKTARGLSGEADGEAPASWDLSPEQEAAVRHGEGHSLIIAGPGTGKTALLAARVARLVSEGVAPESILALTFTVKAAEELKERIAEKKITAASFHAFCASLLREHSGQAGIPKDFRVLDEEEQQRILEEALRETAGGKNKPRLKAAAAYIEERKRFLLLPGQTSAAFKAEGFDVPAGEFPAADPPREAVYAEYRKRLKALCALDFDDLIAGALRLLACGVLAPRRYSHIFVDEYQDVNFAQYALIRLLAPAKTPGGEGPRLCVIGDPDQAIYAFRGADPRYIDRFREDYPGAAVYRLTKSFRCASPILRAAGLLTGRRLTGRPAAASLYRCGYPTEKAEAEGIARRISRLIGGAGFFALDSGIAGGAGDGGLTSLGDCAILLRASALAAPIEKALKDHGIPFHLAGEKPWREELRVYVEAVSILTMHSSKGLEFDHVFVAGLEEGILPFTLYDEGDSPETSRVEEEKRLLYVAMTRARTGLYLSWARSRVFRGRKLELGPSRFLGDLEGLVPLEQETLPPRKKDPQLRLF